VFKIEKDAKTLILAVVIIIMVAGIAVNFGPTGKAIVSREEKVTKISLFSEKPDGTLTGELKPTISGGSNLYVSVETGSLGSGKTANIFRKSFTGRSDRKIANINLCYTDANCGRNKVVTTNYLTSTSWEDGIYYVRVKDILLSSKEGKEVFVTAEFNMK